MIRCPSCGREYNLESYPPNYRFQCSCGEELENTAEGEDYEATKKITGGEGPSSESSESSEGEGNYRTDGGQGEGQWEGEEPWSEEVLPSSSDTVVKRPAYLLTLSRSSDSGESGAEMSDTGGEVEATGSGEDSDFSSEGSNSDSSGSEPVSSNPESADLVGESSEKDSASGSESTGESVSSGEGSKFLDGLELFRLDGDDEEEGSLLEGEPTAVTRSPFLGFSDSSQNPVLGPPPSFTPSTYPLESGLSDNSDGSVNSGGTVPAQGGGGAVSSGETVPAQGGSSPLSSGGGGAEAAFSEGGEPPSAGEVEVGAALGRLLSSDSPAYSASSLFSDDSGGEVRPGGYPAGGVMPMGGEGRGGDFEGSEVFRSGGEVRGEGEGAALEGEAESRREWNISAPAVIEERVREWEEGRGEPSLESVLADSPDLESVEESFDGEGERRLDLSLKLALILSLFVVFGPLVAFFALRGRGKAQREPDKFRGARWGTALFFIGILETFVILGLFIVSSGDPIGGVRELLSGAGEGSWLSRKEVRHPEILSASLAEEILKNWDREGGEGGVGVYPGLYVYQKGRWAYAHWYDEGQRVGMRALFLYSNSGRWHLIKRMEAFGEEARVFEPGGTVLKSELAKRLIRKFWKLRGGFSNVKIESLYVVQRRGEKRALAYWKLSKKLRDGSTKNWLIRSRFRRSNAGNWHLVRYAERIPSDEQLTFSISGKDDYLSKGGALKLLRSYASSFGLRPPDRIEAIYITPNSYKALVFWKNGKNKKVKTSLFRFSTDGNWYLSRFSIGLSPIFISPSGESDRLDRERAEEFLLRALRERNRLKRYKLELYVFQDNGDISRAWVRWSLRQLHLGRRKRGKKRSKKRDRDLINRESLFLYSQEGHWILVKLRTSNRFLTGFSKRGGSRLSSEIAKSIIRLYWREYEWQSSFSRFSGAKIYKLYIYQEDNSRVAYAHWIISNNGLLTGVTSLFFYSNDGRWYLGKYDLGRSYLIDFRERGEKVLKAELARKILEKYLKKKRLSSSSKIADVFCFQDGKSLYRAFVGWVTQREGRLELKFALFHRSNDGYWYLSDPKSTPPSFLEREL